MFFFIISGLDPAYPLFEDGSNNRHLRASDARFVDIIHTDGGILGNPHAMGHADFYPNGGIPLQPGCARQEIANNRWLIATVPRCVFDSRHIGWQQIYARSEFGH